MARTRCPRCTLTHSPLCPTERRWPLAPLVEAMRRRGSANPTYELGIGGEVWKRATAHGLTDATADRWAVRAGWLPWEVWPDWIDAGLSVVDRQRIEGGWRPAWLHAEQTPSTERQEDAA